MGFNNATFSFVPRELSSKIKTDNSVVDSNIKVTDKENKKELDTSLEIDNIPQFGMNRRLGNNAVNRLPGTGGLSSKSMGGTIYEKSDSEVEDSYMRQPLTTAYDIVKRVGNVLKVNWDEVDIRQFKIGLGVELEHGKRYSEYNITNDDLYMTAKIVLAHLKEDSKYYDKLKKAKLEESRLAIIKEKRMINFKLFKSLEPNEQYKLLKKSYAQSFIGEGSSRTVYIVGNGKAIKFAINQAGIEQNREEYKQYKKNSGNSLIAKVYDASPTYHWILAELANPLTYNLKDEKRFAKLFGIEFRLFFKVIKLVNTNKQEEIESLKNDYDNIEGIIFAAQVGENIKKMGIDYEDVDGIKQWGFGADNRLILLDFGITDEIYNKHYKPLAAIEDFGYIKVNRSYPTLQEVFFLDESKKYLDFNKFKAMEPNERWLFLGLNPKKSLGTGSSRQAFAVDSKRVLKLALNERGFAQNEAEVDIYTNPKIKPIINHIFDYASSDYGWLLVEIVRPLRDPIEFSKLTNVYNVYRDFYSFINNVKRFVYEPNLMVTDEYKNKPQFFRLVVEAIIDADLNMGDISLLNHWGKTSDGRVVLYDYGATEKVIKAHYPESTGVNDNTTSVDSRSVTKRV